MKNVIYCFYEKPLDWHQDYGQVCIERGKEYAESIGADFKVFDKDFFPPIVKEVDNFYKQKRYEHRSMDAFLEMYNQQHVPSSRVP